MPKFCYLLIMLTTVIVFAPSLAAQTAGDAAMYRVETSDGSIFVGELISENEDSIVLRTESAGEITIRRESIISMTELNASRVRNDTYWYENPNPTRYLLTSNSLGLQKGQGYYQNTWVFLNSLSYGVSDRFSLGVGTVPLFFFGGAATPVWLNSQLSAPVGDSNIHLSAGAIIGGIAGGGEGTAGGIFYGAGTYGTTDKNLTIGLGYDGSISSTPVLNIGSMFRIAQKGYIITESYFFPGTDVNGLVSAGYRYAAETASVDFALLRPLEDTGPFIGIPWLGITLPFGK
ncbi:MAG: hypothetical protein ACOC2C_06280 [Cyclonatronaceae bacterium]